MKAVVTLPDGNVIEGERWVTIGQARNTKLLLVVHTYLNVGTNSATVRLISARPATLHEQRQYEAIP